MKNIIILLISFSFIFSVKSQTIIGDSKMILKNKNKISSSNSGLKKVLNEANQILKKGNLTVTNKIKIPKGGTKHDYYSLATYWWPDPTKKNGEPYISKDGKPNPERLEIKDFENLKELCHRIRILGIAYNYTGSEEYVKKANEMLKVWFLNESTRVNPNLNYSQSIPGKVSGRPEGMIDTKGYVDLLNGLELMMGSSNMPSSTINGLKNWFNKYIDWMLNSELGKRGKNLKNNIETVYYMQILSYCKFVGNKEVLAERLINSQVKGLIASQFDNEGKQPFELNRTNSWSYSTSNLVYWFNVATLSESYNIDLWNYVAPNGRSLEKGFTYLYNNAFKEWKFNQAKRASLNTTIGGLISIASKKFKNFKDTKNISSKIKADHVTSLTLSVN